MTSSSNSSSPISISDEEQELLKSVFPEIQSISIITSSAVSPSCSCTFQVAHPILGGNFKLSFSYSPQNEKEANDEKSVLVIKASDFEEDKIDFATSSNFEVFVKKAWQEFLADENNNHNVNDQQSFLEIIMAFMPLVMTGFELQQQQMQQQKSSSSSIVKGGGNKKSFDLMMDDDHEDDSDEDDDDKNLSAENIENWDEFFRKQHDLKVQRQQQARDDEEKALKNGGASNQRGPFRTTDEKYFVLIHEYHHIYSTAKQKYMVEKAIDYDLQGIMLRGKPGRCIIEGKYEDVTTWGRLVKGLRWQRCTEVGVFETMKETDGKAPWIFDSGYGYRKCESEADLKQMLTEETTTPLAIKFFHYAFPSIIHPTRTAS